MSGSPVRTSPTQAGSTTGGRTILQIGIDQGLVADPSFVGEFLEICNCGLVQTNRYSSFEPARIGIGPCFCKVVLFSHDRRPSMYARRSRGVALRAEIIRILPPASRYAWTTT